MTSFKDYSPLFDFFMRTMIVKIMQNDEGLISEDLENVAEQVGMVFSRLRNTSKDQ